MHHDSKIFILENDIDFLSLMISIKIKKFGLIFKNEEINISVVI